MRRAAALSLLALLSLVPSRAAAQEIDEEGIAHAVRELERVRGEKLGEPPPIQRLRREDFRDLVSGQIDTALGGAEQIERLQNVLRGLDLLDREDTLLGLAMRFLPASVGAQYDPYEKRIRVLGNVRGSTSLLVHELTHALDDRRFDLRAKIRAGELDFDRLLALGALAEGSAESVQRSYDTNGGVQLVPLALIREQGEKRIEQYLAARRQFPRFLARSFIFQYFGGFLFVQTEMRRRGEGWTRLDEIFRDPPQTTEQVLHPEKYRAKEGPKPVREIAPDGWRETGRNRLGELGTAIVIEAWRPALGWRYAARAAQGWGGDRIVTYERDGRRAMIWRTVWDDDGAAYRFAHAMRIAALRGDRIEAGGVVVAERDDGYDLLAHRGREVTVARDVPRDSLRAFVLAIR